MAHATRAFGRMRKALQDNEAQRRQLEEQFRQAQKMEAMGRLAGGVAHDFNNVLSVILELQRPLLATLTAGDPRARTSSRFARPPRRAAGLTRQLLAFSRQQVLEPKRARPARGSSTEMDKMLQRLMGEDVELLVRPTRPRARKADPARSSRCS